MFIPFLVSRNCDSDWGDSFISGKELLFIVVSVFSALFLCIFIILPILEFDKERSLRVATYHKDNKEFIKYVLEATSDDFLSPWERIVIKYKYTELESLAQDKRDQERINDAKIELVNSLNLETK